MSQSRCGPAPKSSALGLDGGCPWLLPGRSHLDGSSVHLGCKQRPGAAARVPGGFYGAPTAKSVLTTIKNQKVTSLVGVFFDMTVIFHPFSSKNWDEFEKLDQQKVFRSGKFQTNQDKPTPMVLLNF